MESLGVSCCVFFPGHSPASGHMLHGIKRETSDELSPFPGAIDVEVKREMLEQDSSSCSAEVKREVLADDTSSFNVEAGNHVQNVAHADDVLEPNVIAIKIEPENAEELACREESSPTFLNPFSSIRERLKKMRSRSLSKVTQLVNQIKSENISFAEDQTEILSPLDNADTQNALHVKEEFVEQKCSNTLMPNQYTINESELIIKSEQIYGNTTTSSKVDVFTNTEPCDFNFIQEPNYLAEDFATVDEPSLPRYNDVSHECANDNVTNVINNPLSYSVRIINVASLAERDGVLNPTAPPQATLKKKVGRPKRSATAKQISYSGSVERTKMKLKYKKRKITKKSSPKSESSNSNKTNNKGKYIGIKDVSKKATDFPRPLKVEIAPNSSVENDIAIELPRPIVLKCEAKSSTTFGRYYRSSKLQPKVCLKRLSCHDITKATHKPKRKSTRSEQSALSYSRADVVQAPKQLHVSNIKNNGTSQYRCNNKSNDISHRLSEQTCYQSSIPEADSSTSNSHFDSGVSTSSHSHEENENVLLEIAAERAFINHHLTSFGFSPVRFGLYNDFNELCIFLKYLCGNLNN